VAALITASASQRTALRDLMAYRLFVIGDRRLAAAVIEGTPHEQLAAEFGEDLRLMGDVGWDQAEHSEVVLTMERRLLELTLRRMRQDAVEAQTQTVPQRPTETDEERTARFKLAEQVCDELLAALD
jgi:hypothetical protein